MSKKSFIGRKLKEARMYRGKTVDILAKETKINKKDILAFEDEKYQPTLENEMKLANNLNFPKEFFKENKNLKIVVETTHIRPECTIPKVEQISYKEKITMTQRVISFIEGYISFPKMNIPNDLNINDDIEELATKIRRYWELGDGIIGNMQSLLEINGIIVSDINVDRKGAISFKQKNTTPTGERYVVALGNDKKSACTRNFDLAYELAYMVLTEANIQSKKFSKEEFACAFLLPKESFTKDIQNAKEVEDYIELKKKWIVPMTTLIFRAYNLGEISYKKYMYLMNEMDKRGWLKKEPLEENIKATNPVLLKKSMDMIMNNNIMTKDSFMKNINDFGVNIYYQDVEELLGLKKEKLSKNKPNNKSNVTKVNFKSRKK